MDGMSEVEARELARRLLARELPRRWTHVQAVAATASRLCERLHVDRDLVVSASWLHDIGYATGLGDTGFHPLDGSRYLRANGWDDAVCCLVAHHTDAASQAPSREVGDQLRAEFDDAGGLERDVLWTADCTTGPNGEVFSLAERIDEIAARYGPDDLVTLRMVASRPALESAIERVEAASR